MLMWRFVFPVVAAVIIGYVFAREDLAERLCKERGIKAPALKPGFRALAVAAVPVFLIYGFVFFRWYLALGLVVGGVLATVVVAALLSAVAGPWLRRRAIAALAARLGLDISAIPIKAEQWRDGITALEDVKDRAIALFEAQADLDAARRAMWIGDLKETYHGVVMAHQLLHASLSGEKKNRHDRGASALVTLDAAKSRKEQAASELHALGSDAARGLASELRGAWALCEDALRAIAAPVELPPPPPPPTPPQQRVVRAGEDEWQVLCQVCGALAMRFTIGTQQVMGITLDEAPHIVYEGLTKRTTFELDRKQRAWALLGADDLKGLHALVSDLGQFDGGLDGYCPKCDKVYCRSHYATEETWDEGFYDCTYGTCPKGHRRIIDD